MSALARGGSFWVALWGGAAAALVLVIGVEHYLGSEEPAAAPRAPAKVADARMLPPFSLASVEQVAPETAERPLFIPTRRPAPPAATVQPTMRKGQFVLTGVTVSSEASFAFLRELSTGKTKSVRQGAEVNGLRVDAVEPRRVVLRQGDETEDLFLAIQSPPKVAAPPPGTPGAPGAPGTPGAAGVTGSAGAPQNIFAPGGIPLPGAPGGPPMPGTTAPPGNTATTPPKAEGPSTGRRRPYMNP